jgi:hypothetical protein
MKAVLIAGTFGLAVLIPSGTGFAQTLRPGDTTPPPPASSGCCHHDGYYDQHGRWHNGAPMGGMHHGYYDDRGRWHNGPPMGSMHDGAPMGGMHDGYYDDRGRRHQSDPGTDEDGPNPPMMAGQDAPPRG